MQFFCVLLLHNSFVSYFLPGVNSLANPVDFGNTTKPSHETSKVAEVDVVAKIRRFTKVSREFSNLETNFCSLFVLWSRTFIFDSGYHFFTFVHTNKKSHNFHLLF